MCLCIQYFRRLMILKKKCTGLSIQFLCIITGVVWKSKRLLAIYTTYFFGHSFLWTQTVWKSKIDFCFHIISFIVPVYHHMFLVYLHSQWEFQDPKMEVMYHRRPYFVGISPYIGLIYGKYLQFTRNGH